MARLTDQQLQDIMSRLQENEPLPAEYKPLLFTSDYASTESLHRKAVLPEDSASEPAHILVVDDNEFNRDLLTDQLTYRGYQVTTAIHGQEALDLLHQLVFDLILLDIMMPVMDGYEVLQNLREHPHLRHVPVIVISAVDDKDSVIRCIEMGAEDYLFKPFDSTLLKARINASLEKKRLRDKEQQYLQALEIEQRKSEQLLLNVLPAPIAERLKENSDTIADSFTSVSVLFADIVDFTAFSADVSPIDLVEILNNIFSTFDMLADRHGLEKIKTVGDAYMVVGGLPTPRPDHAEAVAEMALDIREAIRGYEFGDGKPFQMRIGINSGPVVAGVIGTKKFIYDLWGDTVNIASRMETLGLPGRIQVTQPTRNLLDSHYSFEPRGTVRVKGRGDMQTYWLVDRT